MKQDFRTFRTLLTDAAHSHADKPFVESIDQECRITYGEMAEEANRISAFLDDRGVGVGERVVLLTENSLENVVLFIGLLCHGVAVSPINVEYTTADIIAIIDRIAPCLVLHSPEIDTAALRGDAPCEWILFDRWPAAPGTESDELFARLAGYTAAAPASPEANAGDIALIAHTSGTEDKPKGVLHSYGSFYFNSEACAARLEITAEDRILEFRSFSWLSPMVITLGPALCRGATIVLARTFSRSEFFEWLAERDITIAIAVPTVINMLLNRPAAVRASDFPALRFMTSSSAPLMPAQHRRFEDTYGIPIVQLYGMSEVGWIAGNGPTDRSLGSVGRPMQYQRLRILDRDGGDVATGEIGRIVVSGPQISHGYLLTRDEVQVFGEEPMETGDMGTIDPDGFLYVTGREKDLIIRGGVNIAPMEIDNVLLTHPDVAEAVTIGVPDPIYGEAVVCYVAPKEGRSVSAASIIEHCEKTLAEFKVPREVCFLDKLPKTHTGKLRRMELVESWKRTAGT